jgi:hypothetical protein
MKQHNQSLLPLRAESSDAPLSARECSRKDMIVQQPAARPLELQKSTRYHAVPVRISISFVSDLDNNSVGFRGGLE